MRRLIFCVLVVVVSGTYLFAQRLQKVGQLPQEHSLGCWDNMNNNEDAITLNGVAYFTADDGIHGAELWRSDGTETGTWMVKDIYNSIFQAPSRPHNFFVHNNEVYFSAFNEFGAELWKTDGTAQGTVMVADINVNGNAGPLPFASYNNQLYLFAYTEATGMDMWRYDGQQVMPFELIPGSEGLNIGYSPQQNYWSSTDLNLSFEFDGWLFIKNPYTRTLRTNGQIIEEIKDENNQTVIIQSHIEIDDKLYAYQNSGSLNFYTLNKGDIQFKKFTWTIPNVSTYGYRSGPFVLNNKLHFISYFVEVSTVRKGFFSFNGQQVVLEYEFPDGTTETISKLKQVGNDCYFFRAHGDEREIWKYDGTTISQIATPWIFNDPYGQYKRYHITEYNNKIYWLGRINNTDELWYHDPATNSTGKIDFNGDFKSIYLLKDQLITNSGLMFLANGDEFGFEPRLITTQSNTPTLIKDINQSFMPAILKLSPYRDHLYFPHIALNKVSKDGMLEMNLGDIQPGSDNQEHSLIYSLNDKLIFFSSSSSAFGIEPCVWNGTTTQLVKDINPGSGRGVLLSATKGGNIQSSQGASVNPLPEIINNVLVFIGDDGTSRTFWRTDGTAEGTYKINNQNFSLGNIHQFLKVDNRIYFKTTGAQPQYWVTDGTTAWQINDVIPALDYRYFGYVNDTIIGNNLLQTQPFELSFTDGLHGTSQIIPADIYANQYTISVYGWQTAQHKAFFVAKTAQHGSELWMTDASNAYLVKDIIPGTRSSFEDFPSVAFKDYSFFSTKDTLYFITRHQTLGRQLWKTAGTEASTEMLTQLEWGDAIGLTYWRGKLYFFANNGGIYSYKLYPQEAQLTLQNQQVVYDGTHKQIEFTTDLPLNVLVLYNGEASLPVNAGTYAVTIESLDPDIYLVEETTFTITKAIQTIAHDLVVDIPSGSANDVIMLNASSSSGLPVTVEVTSGPAIVSEGNLVLTGGSGTVEVLITQSGNDNYEPTSASFSFDVDIVMTNETELSEEIKVYPNPSTEDFTIEFGSTNPLSITIMDLAGKKINESTLNDVKEAKVQVANKGIYILLIQTMEGMLVKKLMVK